MTDRNRRWSVASGFLPFGTFYSLVFEPLRYNQTVPVLIDIALGKPDTHSGNDSRQLKQLDFVSRARVVLAFGLTLITLIAQAHYEIIVWAATYLVMALATQWSSKWLAENYLKHLPILIDVATVCAYTFLRRDDEHPLQNIMAYTAGGSLVVLGASMLLCRPSILVAIVTVVTGYLFLFHDYFWNAQVSFGAPFLMALMAVAGFYIHRLSVKVADDSQRYEKLCRFLAPQVVSEIDRSGNLRDFLKANNCEITVMFIDIRGFTSLSEKWAIEATVDTLNEYFSLCTRSIYKHAGTVDKFIGDGVMALFGAPISSNDDAIRAVRAALDIQQEIELWNTKREAKGKERLRIGIGMNTSTVMAGAIGTSQRMEYTAIGDGVNVAARLCEMTKEFKLPIVFSESTKQLIEGEFQSEPLGEREIRGRTQKLGIYTFKGQKTWENSDV
ncbi:MAG: adenylate/guanylate cyclase domain-containing protein [Verrucomicrobiota bacterium]